MKHARFLVIAGTASGVGKTSISLGLARAIRRRSLCVQPFKVGPDYLDPSYLSRATGCTCYNLDGWMTDRTYVHSLSARAAEDADIALVEGVMGLFDGADPAALSGSTAEIARWLDSPVVLIADAHGQSRSFAAIVKGFVDFEPQIRIAGVIANRIGSDRHRQWLAESLRAADIPPLLGAIPRGELPSLESRHLGLNTADRQSLPDLVIEQLADACERYVDIDAILSSTRSMPRLDDVSLPFGVVTKRVRIGVARDAAFHFCYPDNLEALSRCGAEIVYFSPMSDSTLPDSLDGIYLPGGYPEIHAARLSNNQPMVEAIRNYVAAGKCLYAECGGLMYLGSEIEMLDGKRLSMTGVLPIVTRMLDRKKTLGYVETTLLSDTLWGQKGTTIRGHEFHYSEIVEDRSASEGWKPIYAVRRRRSNKVDSVGFYKKNVLAAYPHLHWAARYDLVKHFIQHCEDLR